MRRGQLLTILGTTVACCVQAADDKPKRPIDGIMDNSFLVEEAYNQEPGIVQHIFTAAYGVTRLRGPDAELWNLTFTQEWPVPNQTHQFSYTVPYNFFESGRNDVNGVGDVLLNYRYQAYFNEKSLTAFAPRLSLVLPTGDVNDGFGSDTLGYQLNLPFSTTIGDRIFVHANAGLTFLPEAGLRPRHDFVNYNLGASAIYCVDHRLNFLVEWIGAWNESSFGRNTRHDFASVISPGARYALNFSEETQLVLGAAVPVGLNDAAPDIGVFVYLSFEHRLWGQP